MTLKNWQTNKKSNTAQKKGANKGKAVAKKPLSAKKPEPTALVAEPHAEADAAPEAVETAEHIEPHASKEPADEILVVYEPTETDGAATETTETAAEEVVVEVEQVEPAADDAALATAPEAEAATAEPTPAVEPAQHEPAAAEPGTEAEVMVTPEETQAADETQAPEEAQKPEEAPATEEPQAAEPAPIAEGPVATEQPAAAPEPATSASAEGETKPTSKKAQPRERDPRLPPPGTILQRRDRHGNVRCECLVEEDGIRYQGTLYKSLSAAAIAATKDLGLRSETQNGHTFWGTAKPARPAKNVLESLERAWERYREHAEAAAGQGANEEECARVRQAIEKHAETLAGLRTRVV